MLSYIWNILNIFAYYIVMFSSLFLEISVFILS